MVKLGFELSHTKFRWEGGNRYSRRLLELYDSLGVRLVEFPVHRFLPVCTLMHGCNRFFRINNRLLKEFDEIISSYDFKRTAHALNRADITLTRHRHIINACLQIAERLDCEKTVFHASRKFFRNHHDTPKARPFLSQDDYPTQICIENLEPHANPVRVQEWAHEHDFKFCFDVGHFSLSPGWNYEILPKLKPDHIHAHNNDLRKDLHAPIHQGSIDFAQLFRTMGSIPETIIMELHAEGDEQLFYKQAWERAQELVAHYL